MVDTEANIVCGIDDSVHGRAAAGMAQALAERLGVERVLVHAMAPAVQPGDASARAELPTFDALWLREREAARRLVEDVRGTATITPARVELGTGSAARCIAAVAAEERAGLVVVGSRGRGGVDAAVLGSVTAALVRTVACPVLVVPPAFAESGAHPLSGEAVVCGLKDAGDLACARVAQRLAQALDAPLTLAHVLPAGAGGAGGLKPPGPVAVPTVAGGLSHEGAARAALAEVRRRLPGEVDTDLELMRGDAGEALVELSVARDAALVVVGCHRWRGPFGGTLRRSVSRHLACHGRRPVVVCPPPRRSR